MSIPIHYSSGCMFRAVALLKVLSLAGSKKVYLGIDLYLAQLIFPIPAEDGH